MSAEQEIDRMSDHPMVRDRIERAMDALKRVTASRSPGLPPDLQRIYEEGHAAATILLAEHAALRAKLAEAGAERDRLQEEQKHRARMANERSGHLAALLTGEQQRTREARARLRDLLEAARNAVELDGSIRAINDLDAAIARAEKEPQP